MRGNDFNKRATAVFGEKNRDMCLDSPSIWMCQRLGRLVTYIDAKTVTRWVFQPLRRRGTEDARVLDVGAGKGRMTRHFAQIACSVIALEPFDDFFRALRVVMKPYKNVKTLKLTLKEFVVGTRREFDLIFASGVIPYLDDEELEVFFADAIKCLSPQGVVFIRALASASTDHYTTNDINRTKDHLCGVAAKAGLQCLRSRRSYPPFLFEWLHSTWPNALTDGVERLAFSPKIFWMWEYLSRLNIPRGKEKYFFYYLFRKTSIQQ